MDKPLLTPPQERALHASLLIFEKALRTADHLLSVGEEQGIYYFRKSDLTPAARESLHQLIQNTLLELEAFSKTVNIKPLMENLEGNIMGDMSISWESLEESRSRRMTGYGALNPLAKEVIDPAIDHFAKIALEICNLTMPRAPEEMTDMELWP